MSSKSKRRVLVIGADGRAHALAEALTDHQTTVYMAPGNAGWPIERRLPNITPGDFQALVDYTKTAEINLVVVSPEGPLVNGIVDAFHEAGLMNIVGPLREAAMLTEGSKIAFHNLAAKLGLPVPEGRTFRHGDGPAAKSYIRECWSDGTPVVIKFDGLAAGKGVIVPDDLESSLKAYDNIVERHGPDVLIQHRLYGREASAFALCDGAHLIPFETAIDYKRAGNGDQGPMTGGMGAVSPAPRSVLSMAHKEEAQAYAHAIMEETGYTGFLYLGLMVVNGKVTILETNCRLGDPEAQVVLPRLSRRNLPFYDLLMATTERDGLQGMFPRWKDGVVVAITLAAPGYPGQVTSGDNDIITGIVAAKSPKDVSIFHAGTKLNEDGEVVVAGGRILTASAFGRTLENARGKAYRAAERISFPGMWCRYDIAMDFR